MTENLRLTASTNAAALSAALDAALSFSKTMGGQPTVRRALARLEIDPADAAALDRLAQEGESFRTAELVGVQIFNAEGRLLASTGFVLGPAVASAERLKVDGQKTVLLWHDGYTLATDNDVVFEGRTVGRVHTEQRLRLFDRLLAEIRASTDSTDALLCSREGDAAVCAPTRFYRDKLVIPMFRANGEINLPINRAAHTLQRQDQLTLQLLDQRRIGDTQRRL